MSNGSGTADYMSDAQWFNEGKANARKVSAMELGCVKVEIVKGTKPTTQSTPFPENLPEALLNPTPKVREEITGVRSEVQELRSEIQLLRY